MSKLICPHCGSLHVYTDTCNETYITNDKMIAEYSGFCMDCETVLNWDEIFVFKEYSNIRIDNEER